jgi:hypothetical protein
MATREKIFWGWMLVLAGISLGLAYAAPSMAPAYASRLAIATVSVWALSILLGALWTS